jgi:protein-disulfide isomerase
MPSPAPSASSRKPLLIGAGVAVAAVLFGLASYTATRPDDPAAPARQGTSAGAAADSAAEAAPGAHPELERLARRDPADGLAIGRADAPVVMIEYADFQCGYCAKFARDIEPRLIEKYVDRGALRIEWRNFPILGAPSESAARAVWAAARQGRFWQFHGSAYAEGAKERGFSEAELSAHAEKSGVPDLERFRRDMASQEAADAVERDRSEAYGLEVTSTPSFLINGRPISGAQPLPVFTEAIEAALRTAKPPAGTGTPATPGTGSPASR